MGRLHVFTAALLSVVLIIAGQGMAFAHTQAPAAGTVVLCTGHGSVTIFTDAEGQPTSAPHFCADCAPALLAILPVHVDALARAATLEARAVARTTAQVGSVCTGAPLARAPPLVPFV